MPKTGLRMMCGHTDPYIWYDKHGRLYCVLCHNMPRTHEASMTVDERLPFDEEPDPDTAEAQMRELYGDDDADS